MWDPNIGMGTVTHQNIGYLLPMGPWYWSFEHVGVPDWVAQRLWLGYDPVRRRRSACGSCSHRSWPGGPARHVATFGYTLTPYVLDLGARLSVILLPYAGAAVADRAD